MAKILFVNIVPNGSTGTICKNLYKAAEKQGHECYFAYGRGQDLEGFRTIRIGSKKDVYEHVIKSRFFDSCGFESKTATKRFLRQIDDIQPDIIHLHNLHGYYINIEMLFQYLKMHSAIKVIWTLHDCWPFTGHCAHFQYEKCEKWKTGCYDCVRTHMYPQSFVDRSPHNYEVKKQLLNGVPDMELITPSQWLADLVKQSFLQNYFVSVIHNAIDPNIFHPTPSTILEDHGLSGKRVILGVASPWKQRKGFESFISLASKVSDRYHFVMIGVSDEEKKKLPSNILGLSRTENQQELAKWYTAAYVYFNPTLEDNYPTTNLEAVSCGTPVLTFDTGGCKEAMLGYGLVVDNTIDEQLLDSVAKKTFTKEPMTDMISEYLKLYKE